MSLACGFCISESANYFLDHDGRDIIELNKQAIEHAKIWKYRCPAAVRGFCFERIDLFRAVRQLIGGDTDASDEEDINEASSMDDSVADGKADSEATLDADAEADMEEDQGAAEQPAPALSENEPGNTVKGNMQQVDEMSDTMHAEDKEEAGEAAEQPAPAVCENGAGNSSS